MSNQRFAVHGLVVAVAAALLVGVFPGPAQAAAAPSATCTNGSTALDRSLGGAIPLPSRFANPTSVPVRFTMRMLANRFFGAARDVGSVTLPAGFGRTYAGMIPTLLHTPLGAGAVVIEVRTDRTGSQVVGRCEYQMRLSAPPPAWVGSPIRPVEQWIVQVPVQMCAIEGSEIAGSATPGQTVPPGPLLDRLAAANTDVWYPQSRIAFSTATDNAIPVIPDPSPPSGTNGKLGDIEVGLALEANDVRHLCSQAWQAKYPGRPGIPVVNARSFYGGGLVLGGASQPPSGLYVPGSRHFGSGKRGDALCGSPVTLTPQEVSELFVVVFDPANLPGFGDPVRTLAHELGHTLFLGHGNGLDDDGDGRRAGLTGPKRYDEFCDPDWLVPPANTVLAEDVGSPTPCSLMQNSACSAELRPLQVETARGVARFVPGFVDGRPAPVGATIG